MIPPLNNISIAVGMRDKPSNIGGTATIGVDRVLQGSGLITAFASSSVGYRARTTPETGSENRTVSRAASMVPVSGPVST